MTSATNDITIDKDVMVTMRDGIRIACDVYRPAAPGKYPVLFATSPYLKDTVYLPSIPAFRWRESGDIEYWVRRGYVYVHADTRGSGKSEGIYRWWDDLEQTDLYDMIEWAAIQPWSAGKVGMIGESYYGIVQWLAAQQKPPHLICIAPYDAGADIYRDGVYHGGILHEGFLNFWYNDTRNRAFLDQPGTKPADFMSYDLLRELVLHPTYDEFWKARTCDYKSITIPVFSIGNWQAVGVHLRDNLMGFQQVSGPKKLMVNSDHPQLLFNQEVVQRPLERWYEYWLKGIDNGIMNEPPVRIFVQNGEGYRDEPEWPLSRAEQRKLYLEPGPSGAVESLNDGVLSWETPGPAVPPTSYHYPDPAWSYPGLGTAVPGAAGLPHTTRKILTFTSSVLEKDLEVTGPIVLDMWASSDQTDTQFIVTIMDQAELTPATAAMVQQFDIAPLSRRVTIGWLKASHRALDPERSTPVHPYHSHTDPQPLVPGEVYKFAVEIWPTSWVFKAGHRIRLDLACWDSGPMHHFGHMQGCDTIYHDAARPSHLVLPVIPKP